MVHTLVGVDDGVCVDVGVNAGAFVDVTVDAGAFVDVTVDAGTFDVTVDAGTFDVTVVAGTFDVTVVAGFNTDTGFNVVVANGVSGTAINVVGNIALGVVVVFGAAGFTDVVFGVVGFRIVVFGFGFGFEFGRQHLTPLPFGHKPLTTNPLVQFFGLIHFPPLMVHILEGAGVGVVFGFRVVFGFGFGVVFGFESGIQQILLFNPVGHKPNLIVP